MNRADDIKKEIPKVLLPLTALDFYTTDKHTSRPSTQASFSICFFNRQELEEIFFSSHILSNIRSAEALPILCVSCAWGTFGERERERERDTERDGSDVTIVALKLAMNLHVPLPKIRTIGDEFTLSLAKNSHFSFLPSHFPSLPSRRGHHCGAEIRNGFTLFVAKKFFALFVPTFSNGASRATSDRKPKTNDQILPSPIL